VRVAVDDFGTGYSSLSYLSKIPDRRVEDRSVVCPPDLDRPRRRFGCRNCDYQYGREVLSLRVVAEGVETQEELAFLQVRDCDEAQGFYFSRPVPPEQFAKLLETGITQAVLQ
jgi:two-component system CheB/CheR fusion protein